MMEGASVSRLVEPAALRVRNGELPAQLRAAVIDGDDAGIKRLLSELLRVQGLTKGQRVSLQLKALLSLVHSLRSATLTDELTGLYNRRGFVQIGTRLLDVATREERLAHLMCFDVNHLKRINDTVGRSAGDVMIRQMGNFMRDLFPSYGVYEALGRLGSYEFAALTISPYAACSAILLRAKKPQPPSCKLSALSPSVGIAHFNPRRPVGIDELLTNAKQAMQERKQGTQFASSDLIPHPL